MVISVLLLCFYGILSFLFRSPWHLPYFLYQSRVYSYVDNIFYYGMSIWNQLRKNLRGSWKLSRLLDANIWRVVLMLWCDAILLTMRFIVGVFSVADNRSVDSLTRKRHHDFTTVTIRNSYHLHNAFLGFLLWIRNKKK